MIKCMSNKSRRVNLSKSKKSNVKKHTGFGWGIGVYMRGNIGVWGVIYIYIYMSELIYS